MMKKLLVLSTALILSAGLWAQITQPVAPTSGTGTKENPYQITSYAELKWFSEQVNQGGDYVYLCAKLMNDIQGSSKRTDGTAYTDVLTPIGRSNAGGEFRGDFDGNGHIICDMVVGIIDDLHSNIGLIGKMIAGSRVHHVGLVDCAFIGSSYVGCLCGDFADGEIDHCFVQGCTVLYTANTVGGLVGSCFTYARLHDCYCSCAMTRFGSLADASYEIGALCGASNATVINCYGEVKESVPSAAIGRTYGTPTTKNVAMKQPAAFASGEVCYLLNGGVADGSQAWYQTLGTDTYPVLDNSHGTVYATKGASGMVYTNTKPQNPTTHHAQSEPTCEQRGFAQECWEDLATGKLYADALCTRELNPAVVIRYAPLAISQVLGNPGNAYEIKETVTFKGVPFSWAAVRRYSEMSAGEYVERRDLEFTVHDYPTDARLKFYKSETTGGYGNFERFTIIVDVYTSDRKHKSRNSIDIRGEEMLSYFSLNGLQKGDIVYVTVSRNLETAGYLTRTTDLAFALEYCSTHCGADNANITIVPASSTNSFRKVQGTSDPEFGYKVEGKVYSAYPLKDITVTREPGETPGTYTVSASCPEGANSAYNITFRTAEFTIADATFHQKANPVDCGHTGIARDYWDWNGTYYPDSSLNPDQVLSKERITAYPKLITPYFTPISGASEWKKTSLIMTERTTETAAAIMTAYGTNITDARLTINWGGTSGRERHLMTTMKYEYKGQTQKRILEVDAEGSAIYPIYFPLEDLKRGDQIKVSCTPPYCGDCSFYVTFNLEYLSDNCGDAGSVTPLTITGTPAVSSKEWDGTTEVEQSAIDLTNCQLVGIETGDEGKVQLAATAEYDNAEMGNNHTVTVTYGLLVADENLAGKYIFDETAMPVAVSNVAITYPQTVTDAQSVAKQALTGKAGDQPSTEVQDIVAEYSGKIDAVTLTGNVRSVIEAIEMIKNEGLGMINSQQSIEQYQRDLATEKTAAKQALKDKVGDTDNTDINNLVTEYSDQIDKQTTIEDVQAVREEGLLAIENALKYYNAGQANALGTLGTKQDGPAVEVIKDEEKVILYNPEKVNFIKVSTEE